MASTLRRLPGAPKKENKSKYLLCILLVKKVEEVRLFRGYSLVSLSKLLLRDFEIRLLHLEFIELTLVAPPEIFVLGLPRTRHNHSFQKFSSQKMMMLSHIHILTNVECGSRCSRWAGGWREVGTLYINLAHDEQNEAVFRLFLYSDGG